MSGPGDDPIDERDGGEAVDDAIALGVGGVVGEGRLRLQEAAARDPALAATADALEQRLAPALLTARPIDPPADLLARIEAKLDRSARAQTLRRDDGAWSELAPGVMAKTLWAPGIVMLRCAPGSRIPAHPHPVWERMIVLSGDVAIDGETFTVGDYHAAPPGGDHPDITTQSGCLIVLHYEA